MAEEPKGRYDFYDTLLLSLAAVATAWCAFQGSVWDGVELRHYSESGLAAREAAGHGVRGDQLRQVDLATFVAYIDARLGGQARTASFYEARFRPEFQTAMRAWLATKPFENPDAPPHPFRMKEYHLEETVLAKAAQERSDSLFALAVQAERNSNRFVLGTVLFSIALFFAGIAGKFESWRATRLLLVVATILFLIATLRVVFLPFHWTF
jgi:hypothetical protein